MITAITFLAYSSLDLIKIDYNTFQNCSVKTFISGNTVNTLIINNSLIENIQNVDSFIAAASNYNFYFINSTFSNISVLKAFAVISSGNMFISKSKFKSIAISKDKGSCLIQMQNGIYFIFDSIFLENTFVQSGNNLFSLKGDINVSNSIFINNGWTQFVDMRKKSALE